MNGPIRVLYVDDNQLDRELVRDALGQELNEFHIVEAASEAEFAERLSEGGYDIVLSDFNILGFDGLHVLDAVHAKDPHLPVLIVTGTGSEDIAIESMKHGAADYILKKPHHIRKLPLTIRDILEKKRVMDEREQAQKERDRLFNYSIDLLCIAGFDGHFKQINPAWQKTLGWTDDEFISRPYLEFVHPEDREPTVNALGSLSAGKPVFFFENRYLCKDGAYKWLSWNAYPLVDEGLIFAIVRDITEHKRDEEGLRLLIVLAQDISLSEDFSAALEVSLRKICETTGWVMGEAWIPDPDGSHLNCSQAWYVKRGFDGLKKFRKVSEGFSFQPGIGIPGRVWSSKKPVWDIDVTLDTNFPRAASAIEAGLKMAMAIPVLAGDLVVAALEFFSMEPTAEDKRQVDLVATVAGYLGVLFQRKQIEEELRKLFVAVEQSPTSVIITDAEGKIEYVNPKFTETTGYTRGEVTGEKPAILKSELSLVSDKEWRGEFVNRKKNGETFWEYSILSPIINSEGRIINFIAISEDITERKQAEEERRELEAQFRQVQKMEAMGQLAGGIAHDFNNALMAILGFSDLLLIKRGDDSLTKNYAEQILAAGQSAARMVQSILTFSRKQTMILKPVDMAELVTNFQKTLLRLIRENIELKIVLKDTPLFVKADRTQLEQVLMNLATNARDAMPDGGIITITADTINIDDGFISANSYGVAGPYVICSFADTGIGMNEETKRKIFEPFFTTKEVGKGTGLGLAMVYGVIKQLNGFISVHSEPGKGTTFRIYLPLTDAVPEIEEVKKQAPPAGGGETILLIEDDERVRKFAIVVLESSGYKVIVAVNGEDGIDKFRKNKDAVRLVICDMIMPKKGGKETYEELKKISPDIKFLFMSGYSEDEIKGVLANGLDFIGKPVSPGDLLRKVREMMDRLPYSSPKNTA